MMIFERENASPPLPVEIGRSELRLLGEEEHPARGSPARGLAELRGLRLRTGSPFVCVKWKGRKA